MRLLVALAVFGFFWSMLRRANELCVVRMDEGRLRVIRGKAPQGLLSDFDDIVGRARIAEGTLRVVSESGAPRLIAPRGFPEDAVQQLRNALGRFQVSHFRTARRPR